MPDNDRIDLYRLIVGQIADALVYSDRQGVIRVWNHAAEALFGFPADEAIGQSLDLIIPERLRAAHWAGFERAMAAGQAKSGGRVSLTRALTGTGDPRFVEMSFSVIVDEQGEAVGSAAMARDVTERHLAQLAAKRAAAAGGEGNG